ncbi:LD-carboxypeptidase [Ruminococcus sp.]|uniref:LD-carboxypeptidase n=1 Tax=Ruminococcus sp. TaxID=41978 RepID=UPI00300F35EC
MLHLKKRVALVGCSDGRDWHDKPAIDALCAELEKIGLEAVISPALYCAAGGVTQLPQERAAALMQAFRDDSISAILDVSGGDSANAVLPFLDFPAIRAHAKPFFGYSDLSVLLNPLRQCADVPVWYFQPRFLCSSAIARASFSAAIFGEPPQVPEFPISFLHGDSLTGTLTGGNIRCTLKLMGTPWQPDFAGEVLFLESCSGGLKRIETMLHQYQQAGAFRQCSGVLLGNFSELEQKHFMPLLYGLVCTIVNDPSLPIACTTAIGHQEDSLCLPYHLPVALSRKD